MNKSENEGWVGVNEVAKHLEISTSFIHKAASRREIPVHRVGKRLRFRLSEIDQWVLESVTSSPNTSTVAGPL